MILFAAMENRNGMMFNHRRVSRDRVVTEKIKEIVGKKVLWIDPYSVDLFPEAKSDPDFLKKAGQDDYCFVENRSVKDYVDNISTLYLFKWNRKYPADLYFDLNLDNFDLNEEVEFPGYSHEKITMQKYERKRGK